MNKRESMRYAISQVRYAEDRLLFVKEGFKKIKDRLNSNTSLSLFDALMLVTDQSAQKAAQEATRRKQMQKLAEDVLLQYDLKDYTIRYISEAVNTVFQVEADGLKYMLRIHPPNHRSSAEIQAELLWLLAIRADLGLGVPEPVSARDGTYVQEVPFSKTPHLQQVVLFKWLDGTYLAKNLSPATMELAGSFMARLHNHAKQFKLPEGISRQHNNWDESWVWLNENYIHHKSMTADDYNLCMTTGKVVLEKIDAFIQDTDCGLVHFDLHLGNYLIHKDEIQAIDFDECQYAPFLFDMAVPLTYLTERRDYESLKAGFLRGYSQERHLPPHHEDGLELFMALRHLDMIAWMLSSRPSYEGYWAKSLEKILTQIRRYNDARY